MLTRSQRILFDLLTKADGGIVTHSDLWAALYNDVPEEKWPYTNIVKVFICKIRKGAGVSIDNVFGEGYRLVKPPMNVSVKFNLEGDCK